MGVFTDLYTFGAAVSKPLSGVLKYGARQADELIDDIVPNENAKNGSAKYGVTDKQLMKLPFRA